MLPHLLLLLLLLLLCRDMYPGREFQRQRLRPHANSLKQLVYSSILESSLIWTDGAAKNSPAKGRGRLPGRRLKDQGF